MGRGFRGYRVAGIERDKVNEKLAYVATCQECGCIVAAMSPDVPGLSKEVARCIRQGYEIDRMTSEQVRSGNWKHKDDCPTRTKREGTK